MIEMVHELQEQTTVFTPLGIRFWDPVLNVQIRDNLRVYARPEKADLPVIRAFRTSSGVYAFQGLPGLQAAEHPDMEGSIKPYTAGFIIEVDDQLHRFLQVVFSAYLPYKGIFPTAPGSPPGEKLPGFYLFSAPTRSVTPGLAAVRGQIVEKSTNLPAAHALLEVKISNKKWYGVADQNGSIAVLFPYPAFINRLSTSPPSQQQWEFTVRVRYNPAVLKYPGGVKLPDFRSIFDQPTGVIWATARRSVSRLSLTLTFGQEIILHTGGLPESILWIDRGSPP